MCAVNEKLQNELFKRKEAGLLRALPNTKKLIDFCSNDYLGWAIDEEFKNSVVKKFQSHPFTVGSSGSRLISGNSNFAEELEKKIASFHHEEAALLFNSGYDANVGFFSCVPKKGDTVIYDELIHASIRDGIRLGLAKSFSFAHNDLDDLKKKIEKAEGNIFVVVEAVYSMDGDQAPIAQIAALSVNLVIDEAHYTGVFEERKEVKSFARIITYGKAFGVHGAAVLGSGILKEYLVNFSRSFIYTTFSSDFNLVAINEVYENWKKTEERQKKVHELKNYFKEKIQAKKKDFSFISSNSLIQSYVVGNNQQCKELEEHLKQKGIAVKAILSPTVPVNTERLRISLHAFNTKEQIDLLLNNLF